MNTWLGVLEVQRTDNLHDIYDTTEDDGSAPPNHLKTQTSNVHCQPREGRSALQAGVDRHRPGEYHSAAAVPRIACVFSLPARRTFSTRSWGCVDDVRSACCGTYGPGIVKTREEPARSSLFPRPHTKI